MARDPLTGWRILGCMRDPVNHPSHYAHPSGVEAIDICEHLTFNLGNALKYLWRAGKKGPAAEDYRKAAWYLRREAASGRRDIAIHGGRVRSLAEKALAHERNDAPLGILLDAIVDCLTTADRCEAIAAECERRAETEAA